MPCLVDDKVSANAEEVGDEGEVWLEGCALAPDANKCFLNDVMRRVDILHIVENASEEDGLVLLEQQPERLRVRVAHAFDEVVVRLAHAQGFNYSKIGTNVERSKPIWKEGSRYSQTTDRSTSKVGGWRPDNRFPNTMMNIDRFLHKLALRFGSDRMNERHSLLIDEAISKTFNRIRSVDPQTDRQFLRLRTSISNQLPERVPVYSRFVPRLAVAAVVLAAVLLGGYFYSTSTFTRFPSDVYATGRGEQKEVTLNDGSQVILNSASELTVKQLQKGKPRTVVVSGEALFRVRRNDSPFTVSTGLVEVNVVGTEFNVRARGDVIEIAVLDGVVNIRVFSNGHDSTLQLTKREMASCPQNGFPRRTGEIPSTEYPGWLHGKLYLDRTSFLAACREIELRFDVTIEVRSSALAEETITGVLDARSAGAAIAALCTLTGKTFSYAGTTYTIR
jgi:ferric-dicitrate binding protein FerR (iron transport regulator)